MRTVLKKKKKWMTIQLPEGLIQQVDKAIATPGLGYTSRSEFIKESVRMRIAELQKRK